MALSNAGRPTFEVVNGWRLIYIVDRECLRSALDKNMIPQDKLREVFPHLVFDDESLAHTDCYGVLNDGRFFGVLLKWKSSHREPESYEDDGTTTGNLHDGLFRTLVILCSAKIETRMAYARQVRINDFVANTRHDFAQKMTNLNMHNGSYQRDIRNAERLGVFAQRTESRGEDYMYAPPLFKSQSESYLKQMTRLHVSLSFLKRTLDNGAIEKPVPKKFEPYSTMLWDFNQQWNNPEREYVGHRKLALAKPYNPVALNSLGRQIPRMFADPAMIERALNNLLDNAFKYAFDRTNVYLYYTFDHDRTVHVYEVTNFCDGIRANFAQGDRLFERGERGSGAVAGTGIGLATARKYARLNGGDVTLVCGSRDDTPISSYSANCMEAVKLGFLKARTPGEQPRIDEVTEAVNTEAERLWKDTAVYNPVAIAAGAENRYQEMVAMQVNKEPDGSVSKTFAILEEYDTPTYAVTFRLEIPHKKEAQTNGR